MSPDDQGWLYSPKFPAQWTWRDLHSLADWTNGLAFRDIQFSASGKPVIKIAEIKNGISGQTKFTKQTFDSSYLVRQGDLLFSWSGQPDTSIDAFWWRGSEGWLNQHVFKVTPGPEVDRTFFYYLLKYLNPSFVGIARNKQTTGLGHVTRRDLENLNVAFPPLPTQRAIARILGALDDKIELNRRMNETLEVMARAVFKSWFVDFDPVRAKAAGRQPAGMDAATAALFPDGFEESALGEIPRGWRSDVLPNVIEVNPRRVLAAGASSPYLDMRNMPTHGHRAINWVDRQYGSGMRFINGDTLLARITPCLENGKTAFVDFLEQGQVGWGSTEYIVFRPRPPLPAEYAYFLARSDRLRTHAIQSMSGTSGRQRVPAQCFDLFELVVPPPVICDRFAETSQAALRLVKANDEQSRTLAAIRDALLPKLLNGEIQTNSMPA